MSKDTLLLPISAIFVLIKLKTVLKTLMQLYFPEAWQLLGACLNKTHFLHTLYLKLMIISYEF